MSNKLNEDQATELRKQFENVDTKIIAITGGKGGVGKSLFSVNISTELAKRGKKVLLFDSDAGFANASILFGKTIKNTFGDYISGKITLNECIQSSKYGVNVITTGFDFKDWKMFQNGFDEMMMEELMTLSNGHDYVIIDIGAGYSEKLKQFYKFSDKIYLITVPEPTAIVNAYTLIKALSYLDVQGELDIIINQIRTESEIKTVEDVLKKTVKNFLGKEISNFYYVMYEKNIRESIKRQIPYIVYKSNSKMGEIISNIVDDILNINIKNKKINFKRKLKNLFGIGGI
ncbi:site-determining protein [Tepiditoga spiralis]|uniref:Site-determining protein n=1 Tax=Tepiditoga spiralis TaxID=2108365 RepID=A0A7G1G5B5_9BACT|nr:AAA family ATPase [Tepiditoga spiralis]BBE31305.1 site-determining protein [Tepiditoga spiralis]